MSADIFIPQDNIKFFSRQGGTNSNSCIMQNNIIIPAAGITWARFGGICFEDIEDPGSEGRHYVYQCSTTVNSITRTNPKRWFEIGNCAFDNSI